MTSTLMSANLSPAPRQRVEDAALAVQLARARRLKGGDCPDHLIVGPLREIQDHVRGMCAEAREVIAVTQRPQTVQQFLPSHRVNQQLVRDGGQMMSFFETRSLSRPMLEFLASADNMPYFCCYGPVQVKLLDRTWVLMDGPLRYEQPTVLLTDDHEILCAAVRYVQAVRSHAVLAKDVLEQQDADAGIEEHVHRVLTDRQRRIAELLDGGSTDEQVADALALSIRTVRYEVARILSALQARNRFGAGRRYGELAH